jgi:hypothetical protein
MPPPRAWSPRTQAAALDAWASAAVDELGDAHPLGHLGDPPSLPHLPVIAADVVVLHAEDAMDAIEGTLQGHGIRHVGLDDLGASWAMARAFFPSGFLVKARTGQWSWSRRRVTAPPCRPVAPAPRSSERRAARSLSPSHQGKLARRDRSELRHGRLMFAAARIERPHHGGGVGEHNTRRLQSRSRGRHRDRVTFQPRPVTRKSEPHAVEVRGQRRSERCRHERCSVRQSRSALASLICRGRRWRAGRSYPILVGLMEWHEQRKGWLVSCARGPWDKL